MTNELNVCMRVAWSFIGTPYIWGGDDPIAGFDCSGFVIEVLKSVGILPNIGDWTADALWKKFESEGKKVSAPHCGCLVLWGDDKKMTHIELCIDNNHCIGAESGGSKTTTIQDAIKQNAFVKVRPIFYRGTPKGFVDPFMEAL